MVAAWVGPSDPSRAVPTASTRADYWVQSGAASGPTKGCLMVATRAAARVAMKAAASVAQWAVAWVAKLAAMKVGPTVG